MTSLFEFKHVTRTEPLANDPFFAWLTQNIKRSEATIPNITLIKEYLLSIGFKIESQYISEESLEILKYVVEHWFEVTPFGEPAKLSELFVASNASSSFYVQGMEGRQAPTPQLIKLVRISNLVYPLHPSHIYFAIINGVLFAKYQSILGSRRLCKLT